MLFLTNTCFKDVPCVQKLIVMLKQSWLPYQLVVLVVFIIYDPFGWFMGPPKKTTVLF